ncbi:MAG: hypothetical protein PF569_01415 [Candidatus Woesearchaeota archaeon]|jgi:hypothetical protein|nr:hypothetical protein [Candidatus Woesearchaeota archaeon]
MVKDKSFKQLLEEALHSLLVLELRDCHSKRDHRHCSISHKKVR